ncbi:DUF6279 family lipoprotein [Vibrio sp.]|uniref:DUF6279 family lipoprotein n=1 Tax=Vibrio sp. TaxID=678 RepID=UPI003D0ED64B
MKRWGYIFITCLLLLGCSTRLVYNNLDWLALQYIDDYVDLSEPQQQLVSDKVAQLSEWHRKQEIPSYISHLDQLLSTDLHSLTAQDVIWQQQQFRLHWQRLMQKLEPELYSLSLQLTPEQMEQLLNNIRKRHIKYKRRYQNMSESQIRQRYTERINEQLTDWLGTLNPAQKLQVENWAASVDITTYDWIEYQTRLRIELKHLIALKSDPQAYKQQFSKLLLTPEQFYQPGLADKLEHNRQVAARYVVKIMKLMDTRQAAHLRDELQDWKQIALELI